MPDCFNLKSIGDTYGISLDILLETEQSGDIDAVAAKVEQIADEYLWAKADRDAMNAHLDLGSDLWKFWKGIYFIEAGDHEVQKKDYASGNLRVCSEYGLKLWDDDGIACVIRRDLADKLAAVGENEYALLAKLASPDGLRLISLLDPVKPTGKETLCAGFQGSETVLNEYLLVFLENKIIAYENDTGGVSGYKLSGHRGICAYLVMAAAYILAKKCYTLSEFIPEK